MACSPNYFDHLISKGALSSGTKNLLDIGTQCYMGAEPADILRFWEALATQPSAKFSQKKAAFLAQKSQSVGNPDLPTAYLSEILEDTSVNYESLDVCPGPKTTLFDLNTETLPDHWQNAFDLVLNFGTTEHVFNQYNAFKVMHEAVSEGGYIFHQVPCSAYFDHGYFTYTPKFFEDLARANNYELIDFWVYNQQGRQSILSALTTPQNDLFKRATAENRDHAPNPGQTDFRGTSMLINVLFRVRHKTSFKVSLELSTSHPAPSNNTAPILAAESTQPIADDDITVPTYDPPGINIAIPCWGEPYLQIFLNHTLKNLVACIKHCRSRPDVHLLFYTTADSQTAVSAALEPFRQEIVQVSVVVIDQLIRDSLHAYMAMSKCHEQAIAQTPAGDLLVFIQPDTVWSINTLQQCLDFHADGAKAVLVPSLRVSLEDLAAQPGQLSQLSSRQLVDIATRSLHPLMMAFFCDGPRAANRSLGTYIHPVLNLGYVVSYFHLHPLMIESPGRAIAISTTIDHDLVYNLFQDSEIKVVRNSDEIFALEISPRLHRNELISPSCIAPHTIRDWAQKWTCSQHRKNACTPVRIFSSHYDSTDSFHRAQFDTAEKALAREFSQLTTDIPYELVY